MEQIRRPAGAFSNHQSEVASVLLHPARVGVRGATRKANAPSAQVDEEQRIVRDQARTAPNFLSEEVSRPGDLQMRLDELLPRETLPTRARRQPVLLQQIADAGR